MKKIYTFLRGKAALDVGCGPRPKGSITIDLYAENRPCVVACAENLPFKNGAVDSIVCSHVLEHTAKIEGAVSELARVLKPNGRVVVFMPNYGSRVWRWIEPFWIFYYRHAVSPLYSPDTHRHFLDSNMLEKVLSTSLSHVHVSSMNLGMELVATCASMNPSIHIQQADDLNKTQTAHAVI